MSILFSGKRGKRTLVLYEIILIYANALIHNDKGGSIYRSNPFYTVKKWLTNWLTLTFFNTIFGTKIRY